LTTYLPIQRKPESGKDIEDAPVVTQYEMHGVEDLGLLKMDFLGLRNLDVISDTLAMVNEVHGVDVDIDNVDLDNDKTYEMLQEGRSIGVFQLESAPMRALIRSMAPTEFEDVAALVALYRPGPMAANMHNDYADRKNGRQEISYLHPDAEEILGGTYGLMIYQESVMRIAQRFAGYSLADADNLRKACGKKIREMIAKERVKFVAGCDEHGYGEALGHEWFDIIEPFADYAFNKSHSYGYGFVSYQTAYLKANYPVEYLACLLTSVKSNLDKAGIYLNECRQLGINVLVPDVNVSEVDFASIPDPEGGDLNAIAFGMSAVRNVGEALVELIIAERQENGPFTSFLDFCERVDYQVLNKRMLESLIKAGAFDSLGHPRKGLLLAFEGIVDQTVAARRQHDMGVMTLFGGIGDDADVDGVTFDDRPDITDAVFEKSQRLALEKEMLGLYVSDHPLMGLESALKRKAGDTIADMADSEDGHMVTVGGVVTGLQRKWTRKGDLMAVLALEDLTDVVETMIFPRTFGDYGHLLEDDRIVIIRGRVDNRDDAPKLMAQSIEIFEADLVGAAPPLRLQVRPDQLSDVLIQKLRAILVDHPGDAPVYIHLNEAKAIRLADQYCVDTSNGLVPDLRVLLGEHAVVV
jgi:DNA polymerase-3 subunit alpha